MILVFIASTDSQPASIPGIHCALQGSFQAGVDRTIRPTASQASIVAAALSRALPSSGGLSFDDRACAHWSLNSDALEIDSARGDQGRHRLRHSGHPLPAEVVARSPVSLPESPKARLVALVILVLVVSVVGKLLGLSSRWHATRVTKRVQVAVRRKVYEHAMRLPLHRVYQLKSGGASSLLREDAGGVGDDAKSPDGNRPNRASGHGPAGGAVGSCREARLAQFEGEADGSPCSPRSVEWRAVRLWCPSNGFTWGNVVPLAWGKNLHATGVLRFPYPRMGPVRIRRCTHWILPKIESQPSWPAVAAGILHRPLDRLAGCDLRTAPAAGRSQKGSHHGDAVQTDPLLSAPRKCRNCREGRQAVRPFA